MSNFLEVDSKILEKNLLLKTDSSDADNFENFLRSPESYLKDNPPWKLVTPTAGLCVKTTDINDKKVFINICKLDILPEPRDVSEAELLEIWQSEDGADYKIPLSILEPHDEFDKLGNPTVAYDVAVNTKFFQKIQTNVVFLSFVMQVVLEGIENKYGVELNKEDYVILQNRKKLGELKPHRIRTGESGGPPKPLIEEMHSAKTSSVPQVGYKDIRTTPTFRLFENSRNGCLFGEFYCPNVVNPKDLSLNVSGNRIVLSSRRGLYSADIFIQEKVDDAKTTASFNVNKKILTVKMPIISSAA